jgi:lipopolysaccharide transport system ATP-binding protein
VGKFLDTPVKRYSSGMRVRLAFSVAAHLEPEILVIDEVLAVGDAAFQKKCMGKMDAVASQGRTVLFVSHNMAAVKSLCTEGLVLKGGQVAFRGGVDDSISAYLAATPNEDEGRLTQVSHREGDGPIRFTNLRLIDQLGQPTDLVQAGQRVALELAYASDTGEKPPAGLVFHIFFSTTLEERLFLCSTQFSGETPDNFPPSGTLRCNLPSLPLVPGQYCLEIACLVAGRKHTMDRVSKAKTFTVIEGDFFGSGRLPPAYVGPFLVQNSWELFGRAEAPAVSGK